MTTTVSILMPAYNVEAYIGDAMESMLAQTYGDFELIVIDDGSSDQTHDVARRLAERDPRVVVIQCGTNRGIANALNRGLAEANGTYIVCMDADDWSFPDRLERQVAFMEAHPEVVISGGTIQVCDSDLRPLSVRSYPLSDDAIRQRLFHYSPFAHPAVIYSAKVARMVGGYNPALSDAGEYDLYFRMGLHGQFANLPDLILRLRTRRDSVSQAKGRLQERLTIYIRFKAAVEYGYHMPLTAFTYTVLQYFSSFLIPPRIKFWLFNRIRSQSLGRHRGH